MCGLDPLQLMRLQKQWELQGLGNCRTEPTVLQINGVKKVEKDNKQIKQTELNTFSELIFLFHPDDSSF